ncbi:MAG: hypothetical protein MPW14_20775 [Candidatus Manganitrophus sp.]|nr:MAG: hypothetical protein MPW14_20775 [Candidatus Manganitrophus sp.]
MNGAVGEGVAGSAIDAEHRADVAGLGALDVLHFVGVHPDQPGDADLLSVRRVVDDIALAQLPLIDADIRQLAVASIVELEGEHDERLVGSALEDDFRFVVPLIVRLVRHLGRVGKVVADAVEQQLNALVLEGRAHHHRGELKAERRLADRLSQLIG